MLVYFFNDSKKLWVCLLLKKYLSLKGIPAKFYTNFENNIMIHSFLIKQIGRIIILVTLESPCMNLSKNNV